MFENCSALALPLPLESTRSWRWNGAPYISPGTWASIELNSDDQEIIHNHRTDPVFGDIMLRRSGDLLPIAARRRAVPFAFASEDFDSTRFTGLNWSPRWQRP
ncbi:MAG: hypothetical protein U0892_10360 [Pirellulales bacterium]